MSWSCLLCQSGASVSERAAEPATTQVGWRRSGGQEGIPECAGVMEANIGSERPDELIGYLFSVA